MEPVLQQIVEDLSDVAARTATSALLVGAHARELCLGGGEPGRRTTDVDFAVHLDDWSAVDRFFGACAPHFTKADRTELLMYHRATGLKVDVVPCGGIESPAGTLALRGSDRQLNTTGLTECLILGTPLVGSGRVVLPPPSGFVLLKLLAFQDRREPRDLGDLGHVVHRFPHVESAVWEDAAFMAALTAGTLAYEEFGFWCVGCDIAGRFEPATVEAFIRALDALRADVPHLRSRVDDGHPHPPDREGRLERADRLLTVLRMSVESPGAALSWGVSQDK
jgi:predicted nucleotidyltransferase